MGRGWLACVACGETFPLEEQYRCPSCGGELAIEFDYEAIRREGRFAESWKNAGGMWRRFAELLPVSDPEAVVSLGEGGTPLVKSTGLAAEYGVRELYFKLESCNPTGSFKDRQITVAMSKAMEWGKKAFGTASSGNVGIALAAYAARANGRAYVWVSKGTARSKRQQAEVYGAKLFLTPDPREGRVAEYQAVFRGMQSFCLEHGLVPMVSARPVNPYMVEGAKTISFELMGDMAGGLDRVFSPVGGGGLFGGLWKGFRELKQVGLCDRLPRMDGVQAASYFTPIDKLEDPAYLGDAYYVPLDGRWAWESLQESGGELWRVSEKEIREAQSELATKEGIFAEPQGATAAAGLLRALRAGQIGADERVVCMVTGTGLKDMGAAEEICTQYPGHQEVQAVDSLAESAQYLT